jgi:hypothetical protein
MTADEPSDPVEQHREQHAPEQDQHGPGDGLDHLERDHRYPDEAERDEDTTDVLGAGQRHELERPAHTELVRRAGAARARSEK